MGRKKKEESTTIPHLDLQAVLLHLFDRADTMDTRSDTEIAAELGMSVGRLHGARLHSQSEPPCPTLGGFVIPLRSQHRGARGAMTLIDPSDMGQPISRPDLRVRTMLKAEEHLTSVMETQQEHHAVACDAAAKEYLFVEKDAARYEALTFAAKDWRELGRLLPVTKANIRNLGIGQDRLGS